MPSDTAQISRDNRSILKGATAALSDRKQRGSDRRVRRDSYDIDDRRAKVWVPINGGGKLGGLRWREALVKTAKEYDVIRRQVGKRGPLMATGIRVFEELLALLDFRTGQLDPSLDTLMKRTGYTRKCVVAALARLKAHRFLRWVRRSRRTDGDEGPLRKQASNAYHFALSELPKAVSRRFRDLLGRAERRSAADTLQIPAAPPIADPALAATLARMAAHFDQSPSTAPQWSAAGRVGGRAQARLPPALCDAPARTQAAISRGEGSHAVLAAANAAGQLP